MSENDKALTTAGVLDLARWDGFLQDIARGLELQAAMMKSRVARADIDSMTRSDPLQDQRFQQALLAADRFSWSALDLTEVFRRIGDGATVVDAVTQVKGFDDTGSLYRLCAGDRTIDEQFINAQRAWARRESQALIGIADDTSRDVLETAKGPQGNVAAVSRDKLRIETRQYLMGRVDRELFGESVKNQVNIQIVNHAQVLEAARSRAKNRGQVQAVTREQVKEAIDATFREVPAAKQSRPDAPAETETPEPEADPFKCLEE